jgi:signal transduction histidine kinase
MWYTNSLVSKLAEQEKKNVELWADAVNQLSDPDPEKDYMTFVVQVLSDTNGTIPRLLVDTLGNVLDQKNLDPDKKSDTSWVSGQLDQMRSENQPITVSFGNPSQTQYVYYGDSHLLRQLKWYPYLQLGVISLFLLVSYVAFSTSRRAEQNQVWVGMAKETAHQLGTPLSSLMAWVEYLKTKDGPDGTVEEIEKDIKRLNTISERFSKIGSSPVLKKENIGHVISKSIEYFAPRTSSKVSFQLNQPTSHEVTAPLNVPLFEWVLENLFKNAVDAMEGDGSLTITITDQSQFVYIDVRDTGKGIPRSKYQTVFKPGYTSKSRGWGLGLSLSKRIVEEYHGGKIFVKSSEANKGTTFRIVLAK